MLIKKTFLFSGLYTSLFFIGIDKPHAESLMFNDGQVHHLQNLTLTDGGRGRGALQAFSNGTTVYGNNLIMSPSSYSSGGAYAGNGAKIVLTNSKVLSETGRFVYGLWSRWDSTEKQSIIEAKQTKVITYGESSHAAVAQNGGYISLTDSTLNTFGSGAAGIFSVRKGPSTNLPSFVEAKNTKIITEGRSGFGIQLLNGKVLFSDGEIITNGSTCYAVMSYGADADGSIINSTIITNGADSSGIAAQVSGKITVTGGTIEVRGSGSSIAVAATNAGIILNGVNGISQQDNTTGLYAQSNASITLANKSLIKLNGQNSTALKIKNGGNITVQSSTVDASTNGSVLFRTENDSSTTLAQFNLLGSNAIADKAALEVLNGQTQLTIKNSSIQVKSGTFLDLSESANDTIAVNIDSTSSELFGSINAANNHVTMTMANGTNWYIPNQSVLSALNITDSAIIFTPDNFNSGRTLLINGDYKASLGHLTINTVLGDDASTTDLLVVSGDTAGTTSVVVNNVGGPGAQTNEGIRIIQVDGASNGLFSLIGDYSIGGKPAVVAGAYAYQLYQGGTSTPSDGDWYLRSQLQPTDPVDPIDPVDPVEPEPLYQPGVPVYEAYPQALLGLNGVSTLQQRVGNRYWSHALNPPLAQNANALEPYAPVDKADAFLESNGLWGRMEGAYTKIQPRTSRTDANYDYNIFKMQAGLDGMFHEAEKGKLIGGITVHYTHGLASVWSPYDSDLGRGRIQTDGYGFGGTLTWYGDNGFYLDNQAQITWYRSDLTYQGGQSSLTNGKNNGFGYTLSSEIGKRIMINDQWMITPQAQWNYSNVSFSSFTDKFGTKVALDRAAHFEMRLGMSAEYQNTWRNAQGGLNRSSVYGIANLYNEFLDGTQVDVSSKSFNNKGERVWAGIGLGGSYNWSDDKYSLYGEVGVKNSLNRFGDSYTYKGTVGLRVNW